MLITLLACAFISLWITLCLLLYGYFYLLEILVDIPFADRTPGIAHSNLKQIIGNLLEETSHLPPFQNEAINEHSDYDRINRTYEELLATAILNKVVNKNSEADNSNTSYTSEKNISNNLESPITKNEQYVSDFETTSGSSLDEHHLPSGLTLGSTKYIDQMFLTVRQKGPQYILSDAYSTCSNVSGSSNWSFQKRPLCSLQSSLSVPMLVPNPVTSSKVLIGDQEIDETSDLSDVGSEYDFKCNDVTLPVITNCLLHKSDEETSADPGVKEDKDGFSERKKYFHGSGDVIDHATDFFDSSWTSEEKDVEYFEKYSLPPRYGRSVSVSRDVGDYYTTKQESLLSGRKQSTEASLMNHIEQLEAIYTYSSLPRSLYTPKNSSQNFVKNPLLNFPENIHTNN